MWGRQAQRSGRVTLVIGLVDLKQWPGWLAHGPALHPLDTTLLTTLMPRLSPGALFISMIPHCFFSGPESTTFAWYCGVLLSPLFITDLDTVVLPLGMQYSLGALFTRPGYLMLPARGVSPYSRDTCNEASTCPPSMYLCRLGGTKSKVTCSSACMETRIIQGSKCRQGIVCKGHHLGDHGDIGF